MSVLTVIAPRCKVDFIRSRLGLHYFLYRNMIDLEYVFSAELWVWQSETTTAWHFVTLPVELSADIKAFTKHLTRGFRSVKVEVRIGETRWKTSLFPSKAQGAYLLPIKKSVRAAEDISAGSTVEIHLRVPT